MAGEGEQAGKMLARIGSAAAGGFLTPIIGPEAGAAAGQAMIETTDVVLPFLTDRAKRNLRTLSDRARAETERRQAEGQAFRADGLLDDNELGADLLEGVLRGAIEAEREQKAAAIANAAVAVAFEEDLSGADALRYLRLIRQASWRQLVALVYFGDQSLAEERELHAARASEGNAQIKPVLGAELSELARSLELIGFRDPEGGSVSNPSDTWGGGEIAAADVGKVAPAGLGLTLLRVAQLPELVTDQDLGDLRADLGM